MNFQINFGEEIARNRAVSIMLPPERQEEVTGLLEAHGMEVTVKIKDVQRSGFCLEETVLSPAKLKRFFFFEFKILHNSKKVSHSEKRSAQNILP